MVRELERLKKIIFQLLLTSEGRTTDFLELIVDDRIYPVVTEQRKVDREPLSGREVFLRESFLLTEKTNAVVSQNIARIYPDSIPFELYSRLLHKKDGIGKIIKSLNLESTRNILASGWKTCEQTTDFSGEVISLVFGENSLIPYKEYIIHFGGFTSIGIHLIEYFNPAILVAETPENKTSKEGVHAL